jgi:hypothetical protein
MPPPAACEISSVGPKKFISVDWFNRYISGQRSIVLTVMRY